MFQAVSVTKSLLLAALVFPFGCPAARAVTIAHWKFEPGNFTADSSGNGNVLTNVGVVSSPSVAPDAPSSGSASFSGSQTTFSTTSNLDLSSYSQLTIEWFMNTSQTDLSLIMEHSPDHTLNPGAFNGQLNPAFGVVGGIGATNSVSPGFYREETPAISGGLNSWHHYAFRIDSTVNNVGASDRIQIFIDGVEMSSDDDTGGPTSTTTPFLDDILYIGSRNNTSSKFAGLLDELRISSGLLEPTAFLNAPVPEPSTGMLMALAVAGGVMRRRRKRRTASWPGMGRN